MKHLMLYEAFKAKAISDIIKYLKGKYDNNIDDFKRDLEKMQPMFDFELSQIRPEEVKYLPSKSAVKLIPDKNTKLYSDLGVYNMKFWFSLDKGYLGSSVSAKKEDVTTNLFNSDSISFIKREFGIDESRLFKVANYKKLKTGDEAIVDIRGYIIKGVIFKQNDKIYIIQNKIDGGEPDGISWYKFGRYSWCLYSNRILTDHRNLHLIDGSTESNNSETEYAIKDGKIVTDNKIENFLDSADYAVVIDINSIYKRGFKKVTDIRQKRSDDKSGATALMSDWEFKNNNKYFK